MGNGECYLSESCGPTTLPTSASAAAEALPAAGTCFRDEPE
eukprot:gene47516-918_t